ncbi:MAG: S8 family serine peptidase, partial [Ilumatobacteraceae bacterium]
SRNRATLMASIFVVSAVSFFSFGIGAASVSAATADPLIDQQWGLFAIGAPQVWSQSTGVSVTVAIIDGGSGPHPDLDANLDPGQSIINGDRTPGAADTGGDAGHGTHVAGIVAAVNGNGIGISGVAPNARLLPIRVFPADGGSSSSSDVGLAIRFAVDAGVRVINLSLGGPTESPQISSAIQYAVGKNILVVAAAGNEKEFAAPSWPAADDNTIAVTAIDRNSNVAGFGQRGDYIDLSAPGVEILSTTPSNKPCGAVTEPAGYGCGNGTSFAAPFVSGAAALLFSARPQITAAQVRFLLISTATDLGATGRDTTFGAGLINLPAAFAALNIMFPMVNDPLINSNGRINSIATGTAPTKSSSPQLHWYRCAGAGAVLNAVPSDCAAITNAVAFTYQLTANDLRKFLRFAVTTTNAGASSTTLSVTSPKVIGAWLKLETLQRGITYNFGQFIGSPSKGVRTVKVLSGACAVRNLTLVVRPRATTCTIKVTIAAKTPFPQLAFTATIKTSP